MYLFFVKTSVGSQKTEPLWRDIGEDFFLLKHLGADP